MPKDGLAICAIVVSRDRAAWMERCARSLLEASAKTPELELRIHVVLNGPDPKAQEMLGELDITPELLPEAVSPAQARNIALEKVDAEWLFFIDDDSFVGPDFFKRFLQTLRQFSQAGVIGGPNLTPPESSVFQRASGVALSSRFATFLSAARYRKLKSIRSADEDSLILCNLFIKRDILDQQPFHPDFFCGEENLLLHELGNSGYHMIHDPELTVLHERRGDIRSLARQVYCYGKGRGRNLRIAPESLKLPQIIPSLCLLYTAFEIVMWFLNGRMSETWLWLVIAYGGLSLFSGFKATYLNGETTEVLRWVFVIFPVIHVSYGVGVIRGWFRK